MGAHSFPGAPGTPFLTVPTLSFGSFSPTRILPGTVRKGKLGAPPPAVPRCPAAAGRPAPPLGVTPRQPSTPPPLQPRSAGDPGSLTQGLAGRGPHQGMIQSVRCRAGSGLVPSIGPDVGVGPDAGSGADAGMLLVDAWILPQEQMWGCGCWSENDQELKHKKKGHGWPTAAKSIQSWRRVTQIGQSCTKVAKRSINVSKGSQRAAKSSKSGQAMQVGARSMRVGNKVLGPPLLGACMKGMTRWGAELHNEMETKKRALK